MAIPAHEEEAPTSSNKTTNKWGPYSGAGDFSTSMVIILAILLCALLFALIIVAFIRIILSNRRNRLIVSDDNSNNSNDNNNKQVMTCAGEVEGDVIPTLRFSAGTELAGVGTECAICLNEFADGDGVRVLPACNHGFHVKCIEGWLRYHSSCPTCRRSCRAPVDPTAEKSSMEIV